MRNGEPDLSHPIEAASLVSAYVLSKLEKTDPVPDFKVYLVTFSYILGNWKAMVSTTLPDQMYYEVTHNAAKGETYIDAYKKWDNICVPDEFPARPTMVRQESVRV